MQVFAKNDRLLITFLAPQERISRYFTFEPIPKKREFEVGKDARMITLQSN